MSVDAIIWVMTAYVFVYYFVARHALATLNRVDEGYLDTDASGGGLPVGMKTSSAIIEMLFDSDLPGDEYGRWFRYELYLARAMLILFVPVFLSLACFA